MHTLLSLVIAALFCGSQRWADAAACRRRTLPHFSPKAHALRPRPSLHRQRRLFLARRQHGLHPPHPSPIPPHPPTTATSGMTIFQQTRDGDNWSLPAVAPFSGVYNDYEAFVTKDGRLILLHVKPPQARHRQELDRKTSGTSNPHRRQPVVRRRPRSRSQQRQVRRLSRGRLRLCALLRLRSRRHQGQRRSLRVRSTDGKPARSKTSPCSTRPTGRATPASRPTARSSSSTAHPWTRVTVAAISSSPTATATPLPLPCRSCVNTLDGEIGPCITPDGQTLIFQSGPRLVQVDLHAALEGTRQTAQRPRSPDPQ